MGWFGQRPPLNWRGWVADIVWWLFVPFAAKPLMNPVDYPIFCIGFFQVDFDGNCSVRKRKGEP